jgi:ferredoxin
MIIYFSGTGNSRYAAQIIQSVTGDNLLSMNDRIKAGDSREITSPSPLVFVCPTYAWRIPRVAQKFILDTRFIGTTKAYFVLTCGDGIANAAHYAKKLCDKKGLTFLGLAPVVMPENYITLFHAPDKAQAAAIIEKATLEIRGIAQKIKDGHTLKDPSVGLGEQFMSGLINDMFYPLLISAKGYYATRACIHCGKCEELCPLNNIKIVNGTPQWGRDCTQCMACICGCPKEAIEYRRRTQGKRRYYLGPYQDKNSNEQK